MSLKLLYFALITALIFFSCSKSELTRECRYKVTVSGICDCNMGAPGLNCGRSYIVTENEFNRLKKIRNESNKPCIYVSGIGKTLYGEYEREYSGYLRKLQKNCQ